MENTAEFHKWLYKMLRDAKDELGMTDDTIAYILLAEGTHRYFVTLGKCGRCPLSQAQIGP